MPFKSEKQRKWMHANKPKMAKKWEKEEVIKNFREIVRMELEGSCGYGIDGKVGDEPAGPHLLKKKKKEEESVDEERDYKAEYKKYGSSTKAKKYRAELNQYNRKKGTYGNGDGKDASHKGGKIVGFEAESKNRGRAEKSRLKKESSSAYGKSIEKIANDRKLKSLSKKDRDTLMKIAKLMKKSNESVNEAKSFKPEKRRKLKSGEVEVMKGRGSKGTVNQEVSWLLALSAIYNDSSIKTEDQLLEGMLKQMAYSKVYGEKGKALTASEAKGYVGWLFNKTQRDKGWVTSHLGQCRKFASQYGAPQRFVKDRSNLPIVELAKTIFPTSVPDQEFDKDSAKEIRTVIDKDGNPIKIKIGRYGLYIQKGDIRATILDTIPPSELDSDYIINLLEKKESGPEEMGTFPKTGEPIYLKVGRYGPYIQTGKKMKSLLPGMKEDDVTPQIALDIISLPKTVGTWPENGKSIKADIGRFGPYIKCEKETRSIPASINLLEITIEQACELLATKRKGATSVLKELGDGIELKDGRYGAYVTDGKINATLPKTTSPDDVTLEIAVELIAKKKAKGPTKNFRKKKAK